VFSGSDDAEKKKKSQAEFLKRNEDLLRKREDKLKEKQEEVDPNLTFQPSIISKGGSKNGLKGYGSGTALNAGDRLYTQGR
jgi:hypothetical protein